MLAAGVLLFGAWMGTGMLKLHEKLRWAEVDDDDDDDD